MEQKLTYEKLKQKIQDLEADINTHKNKALSLRKKIRKLEQISKYYSALMENTEDAILISDQHGKPQAFNSSYKRKMKELLGLDMQPGIQPHTLLDDRDAKKFWESLHQRVLSGEKFRSEYAHIVSDDRVMYFETTFCPIVETDGITGFTEITRDISDRKQAEQRLLYDETLLRHVLDTSPAVIFVKDRDSTILLANKNMAAFYNLPVEDVTGQRHSDLHSALGVHEKEVKKWLVDDREVIDNGVTKHLLETGTDSSNRIRWFETDKYPIDIGDGQKGVLVISNDITERKQAEETLRKSEQKYRNLVESTDDWVWSCDLEGRQTFATKTVKKILGYDVHEVLGVSADTFMHPEDAERIKQCLKRAVKEKRGWKNNVVRWQHKNGTLRFLEGSAKPILDSKGNLIGFSGIDRDITERIMLEEQIRQTQKMEAIGALAGGVAHDFNNLLSIIFGNVDMMLMDLKAEHSFYEKLMVIKNSVTVAAALTSQLLALSRKQLIQPEIMNLNDVIHTTTKMLGRLIGENIALQTSFDPNLKPVKTDRGQIEQVIINLAVNARDAMPMGGRLTIETKNRDISDAFFKSKGIKGKNGPYVILRVSDTGSGMKKGILSHIFDPFYTTKEIGKGTGLGLSTVYGIVKQNDGYIFVESEPDLGSVFEIYLPAVQDVEMAATADLTAESDLSGSGTILVVEDEIELLKVTSGILEHYGYTVIQASNGNKALHISNNHDGPIDLILTDVIMPGMNVREMVEGIQSRRKEVKVLYITGHTDDIISKYGILKPGIDLMQKPFTPERLVGKIKEILN